MAPLLHQLQGSPCRIIWGRLRAMSVSYSPVSTSPSPSPAPTKEPRFAVGARIFFLFSGRRNSTDQLYTVTNRSWLVNSLVEEGYSWYYQARATTADGELVGAEVGPIADAVVYLAS